MPQKTKHTVTAPLYVAPRVPPAEVLQTLQFEVVALECWQ